MFSGSLVIIAHSTPMDKRPIYTSIVGGMFGIASVVGPLVSAHFPPYQGPVLPFEAEAKAECVSLEVHSLIT